MGNLWKLINRSRADGVTGLASMLAYNFFLAVMGVLILIVSTMAYIPVENLGQTIVDQLRNVLPSDALSLIDRTLSRTCLLYTSDAADDLTRVDIGGRGICTKKRRGRQN